jgi:hypothetical protein
MQGVCIVWLAKEIVRKDIKKLERRENKEELSEK